MMMRDMPRLRRCLHQCLLVLIYLVELELYLSSLFNNEHNWMIRRRLKTVDGLVTTAYSTSTAGLYSIEAY